MAWTAKRLLTSPTLLPTHLKSFTGFGAASIDVSDAIRDVLKSLRLTRRPPQDDRLGPDSWHFRPRPSENPSGPWLVYPRLGSTGLAGQALDGEAQRVGSVPLAPS